MATKNLPPKEPEVDTGILPGFEDDRDTGVVLGAGPVRVEAAGEARAPTKAVEPQVHPSQRIRRIMLEESQEIPPTGLFIGHNGKSYVLKTGVPVNVPQFLVDILDHAVFLAPVTNPQTRQVVGHRPRHRFAYQSLDRAA